MSAAQRPETKDQAHTWDKVKSHAVAFGLCHKCAGQLAWGHQLGFKETTRQPCTACADTVAQLPVQKSNGWRTVAGRATRATSWPQQHADGALAVLKPLSPRCIQGPVQKADHS